MELRQLEYFAVVAAERSFTRAAEKVHVAQPGVSSQIRRLERELGQDLLDRSGRSVRLTAAGEAVLPYAKAALAAVEGARTAAAEVAGLVRGRVAVGMVTMCAAVDVPRLIIAFCDEHPGIEVSLLEAPSDVLVAALRDGTVDMAFVGIAEERPAELDGYVLADEALVALVPPDDDLAGQGSVRFVDLVERPLICLPRGSGVRHTLDRTCERLGLTPEVPFEASDPRMLVRLAAGGMGAAVVPASIAANLGGHLSALTITEPTMRARLELATRARGPVGPAARAFVGYTRGTLARRDRPRTPAPAQAPTAPAQAPTAPAATATATADLTVVS